jgi:uncharacterized membrane protein YccC
MHTVLEAVRAAGPPLLFGIRLWASVCLALHVAFWLQLDNAYWAGTSAAIVCQPSLGASLRKGWFRMIGTVVGATMIVVLTACFPQDRIAFLGLLALWGAAGAFAATLLRNFASYAAALAGYTAAIIGADTLGATGGASPEVFMLAVTRASEICIGIVCAGVVLAGTDLGSARRQLAASFAALTAAIMDGFTRMLTLARSQVPDTQPQRREFVRRVIALDPAVDQAIGESSQSHYRASSTLQTAVHGLISALNGWRGVAAHLKRLPDDMARQDAETILHSIPLELRSAPEPGAPTRWMTDPITLRHICEGAMRKLLSLPASTPSLRLLADQTAKLLAGILHMLDALALLVDAAGRPLPGRRQLWPTVPDWLPPLVNAGRAFVVIGAVELFWVVTAWPNGGSAIVFVTVLVVLLSPRGDQAYAGAMAFTLGIAGGIVFAAIMKFAVLPGLETFPAFCIAIGLFLIPAGFGLAYSRQPAVVAVMSAMAFNFVPVLQPANQMSYDTAQFYNSALAIFVGCAIAPLSFRLLPPLPPALRARRLLALTLRDLRRLAIHPLPTAEDWERRMFGRLAALPDQAEPLQRAQLLAAISVGDEVIRLRGIAGLLALGPELEAALDAVAQGNRAMAMTQLAQLDHCLALRPDAEPEASLILRARASILVVSEAFAQHAVYFDAGAPA